MSDPRAYGCRSEVFEGIWLQHASLSVQKKGKIWNCPSDLIQVDYAVEQNELTEGIAGHIPTALKFFGRIKDR